MATIGTKRSYSTMSEETLLPSGPYIQAQGLPRSSRTASRLSTGANGQSRNRTPDGRDSRLATSAPSTPVQPQESLPRIFDRNSSIVLLGARGTGKSTLGVFASTALQRRLVETDTSFQEATEQSPSAFRKLYGPAQYHRRYAEVLKAVFDKHAKGCVIVCSAGSLDHDCQVLMQQFARDHPVIHVLRCMESVQQYLGIADADKVNKLLEISDNIFQGCSNYEYFNYAEQSAIRKDYRGQITSNSRTPYLALKNAEKNFNKFLARATSAKDIPSLEDAFPLSQVNTEDRTFTYAVSVPLEAATNPSVDIEAVEDGADAVELVVDPISFGDFSEDGSTEAKPDAHRISEAIARIRRSVIVPLIYHVKVPPILDAAELNSTPVRAYIDTIHHGLRLAPDFATIDLSLSDETIREISTAKGSTKLIADYHSGRAELQSWDYEVWMAAYERARRLGFDVVRLSWPANSIDDNFQVQAFRSAIDARDSDSIPVIAFNSGPLGRTSLCFNRTLTPVTHPSVSAMDSRINRPCVTVPETTKALYECFVHEPMKFYILGAATGYSLSPAMHNAAYRAYGMPHSYQKHQTQDLKDLHQLVSDPHFGGCSVSLPFKLEVIALTHSLSKHAKAIGAVNTLVPVRRLLDGGSVPGELELFSERNRSGPVKAIYGENTDWQGIRACIRRGLSPANAVGPRTTALLIGAGGMARAAVYAMLKLGIQNIVVFNRTYENAEKLVAHFERLVAQSRNNGGSTLFAAKQLNMQVLRTREEPWPENLRQPTIVVSCIPTHRIGDNPSPDFTLPPQWLKSPTGGVVLEVAYRNLHTPLLEQTRAEAHRGWVAMDGLDLLPEQAFAQFELFTGRRAPRRLMRLEVLRNYRDEFGEPDPSVIRWRIDEITQEMP